MDQSVVNALNDQINFEQYSGFIYLSLALRMDELNYKGFSKWLTAHFHEELGHAQQFIEFMQKREAVPVLEDIEMKQFSDMEPLEAAKIILEHEKLVTERIYKIHDLAKQKDDYATEIFMHQFIEEQIEEEATAREIVDLFSLAQDSISARFAVDRQLAQLATK